MANNKLIIAYQILDKNNQTFNKDFNPNLFDMKDYTIVYEKYRDDILNPYMFSKELKKGMPKEFEGHALAISDILAIDDKFYYNNSKGWIKLDEAYYI